jgi:predicted ABC-type transport system involved in lysophospholipase L1 biosynthesis ATPase subunit
LKSGIRLAEEARLTIGTDPSTLIEAEGLGKTYLRGNEEVVAARDVQLSVNRGEFVVIIGPSGGGKSTLLHLLGGLDRPTRGELRVNGIDLVAASDSALTRFRRDNIGFVFRLRNSPSLNARTMSSCLLAGPGWKASSARPAMPNRWPGSPRETYPASLRGVTARRHCARHGGRAVRDPVDEPIGDRQRFGQEPRLMLDLNRHSA